MTVKDLVKKLNKRDKTNTVYYKDANGYHEITAVEPCITDKGTVTLIMNSNGGRYKKDCQWG